MSVFIAGATGVLGRRVVQRLVEGGHQVIGLSRSEENSDWLKQNGAEPREGDLFNPDQLINLSFGCDVFLHLATSIPNKTRTTVKDWSVNDRIRREGTKSLVETALHHNCKLYVQQSITFIYGDRKGAWVDETAPVPSGQISILQSAVDMEHLVQDAIKQGQLPAVILRFGAFYCYDSVQTQTMFEMLQNGRFPVIGNGTGYWNVIQVDDAANAVIKAVEDYHTSTGHIFNVCDDKPVTYRELADYVSERLVAKKPGRIPSFLAKLFLGSHTVNTLLSSVRCKNDKIKKLLNWHPDYPTYCEGYQAEIDKWLKA